MPNKIPLNLEDYCRRCAARCRKLINSYPEGSEQYIYQIAQLECYNEILHLIGIMNVKTEIVEVDNEKE